ncbi:MAG TPA: MlaD family protein [Kofleriaceae bacterium]|nr:MlaD family protein [Kofleriaceae bacterium]
MLVDERLARRIGAVTLLVLAATIACFVFLLDRVALGAPVRIRVAFHHVAGLREHAPLVVAGAPVGRIEAIEIAQGGVTATVAIAAGQAWKVPGNAEIFIASRGPLSDKFLEVSPPHGEPAPPGPAIVDGQVVRGVDPPDLDNVLQHTWVNLTTFQLFLATVKPALTDLRAQLAILQAQLAGLDGDPAAAVREARNLISAARTTYATALGGAPGVAELRAMLADAHAVIGELRAAIDRVAPRVHAFADQLARVRDHAARSQPIDRAVATIDAARAAIAKLDPVLANLDELAARIASGEGSIGRILTDPEFPEDTRDLGKIMKRQPWRIMATPDDHHQLEHQHLDR